ncbi:zinc-finger homeodomain protein 6 [Ziziphus jujuba]|uniref:Zinc-finger homeodomain protein 6 n=1 Tax=Ziziphus jujuba TaxID=326968 RepID=A0A6P4A6Y0_ZIZJJ|nr:zinc-finger homeodomain protein 6 [Ziziphus jujuba]
MELRGQDKEIGMPSTVGYNSPNIESSSSKLNSSSSLGLGERIRDQIGHGTSIFSPPHHETLDQHHTTLSFQSHFQPLNIPQQHQQKSRKDHQDHQNPDPVPAPISTSSATTIITASGSNFKTPPPPQPTPPPSTAAAVAASLVRYRECLKNHAATTGGHVLDGCGEFMPSGDEGSSDSFKCAACECHRNFHRKEIDGESQYLPNASYYSYNPLKDINGRRSSIATTLPPHPQIPSPPPPPHHHHQHQLHQQQQQRVRHYQFSSHGLLTSPSAAAAASGSLMAPMMMTFGGGGGGWTAAESSSEDLNMFESNYGVGGQAGCSAVVQHHHNQASASKKRFRTKFSQPQKEKMMEFAEKLGWRIQKHDEQDVQQFCSEVGVKRKVFKVWMHNNKQTMKKKEV